MKSPRSILKLLYLFLLFATLTWHSTSGQLVSTKNDNQDVLGVHVPPGRDGWCRKFCESRIACENLFGDDHMGVLLKTRFSMLDGPGEHLFHGRLFGNTVTRQSFKTQFVLDVSYALQISPCKVYVVDISPEQYKGKEGEPSWWDVDNVLISFKFFNTTVDHLKELTRQVQEMGSQIYQGQVSHSSCLDTTPCTRNEEMNCSSPHLYFLGHPSNRFEVWSSCSKMGFLFETHVSD
jgi:hypothetical protein